MHARLGAGPIDAEINNLNIQQVIALVRAEMADPRKAHSVREQEANQTK
jgi:hypothetical protein